MWRKCFFVLALAVCLFGVAMHASAQGSLCTTQFQFCALCGDPPIPGATCWVEITILSICVVPSFACAPPAAQDEACPTNCNAARQAWTPPAVVSAPVNLGNGNTYIQQSDLRVPGLGGGLKLVRTWNSVWPIHEGAYRVGMFGPNWRSTYEERVFLGTDRYMKYSRADGSFWSFAYIGPVWALGAPSAGTGSGGYAMVRMAQAPTTWTITLQDGEQRIFANSSGSLTSIIDRNGNTTQLQYDSTNRLTTVTDPAGRTLTFTYQSPTSPLVTGVSSSVGISLSYAYDSQNRLHQVTNQDSTTLTFSYDSNSFISSIVDSNNKVLESHTYDSSGRGLTSSRALGVEAVALSYPNP